MAVLNYIKISVRDKLTCITLEIFVVSVTTQVSDVFNAHVRDEDRLNYTACHSISSHQCSECVNQVAPTSQPQSQLSRKNTWLVNTNLCYANDYVFCV